MLMRPTVAELARARGVIDSGLTWRLGRASAGISPSPRAGAAAFG